ncbi:T-complex protein 11-like protein 1 [Acanthaster planci]|uniref:T-complex protein 11-like protein 1 n=1 Tax=Acanthaster planci TaxID=133434 RepID=A0A8B8A7W3_ACAPL|nr:T-complex protein 11-like protein 1 [Acanthaster planci]XP_022112146.1 T-complex protein 11-like protein 1 [Acanthaster planci]XP_022112147.1 T-complex protein 11-like protein 1 [Acanthaster planci]
MPLEHKDRETSKPTEDESGDSPGVSNASDQEPALDSSGEGEAFRKRQRVNSPRKNEPMASPHKHATFEELLKTAGLVSNMSLAHEIVVDGNFKLKARELPDNSIEKQVRDIMHKAFWDSLKDQLEGDPPSYHHAVTLLGEIKEILISILLPQHDRLRTQIDEVIDLPLIHQQADYGALDVYHYGDFIISTMGMLCAPARDEEIAKLKDMVDVVELFREIFRVLDLMKLDMANYTLQSLRPHIKQQSVDYERGKFQEFLKTQQDGLELTRKWLEEAADDLRSHESQQPAEGAASSPPTLTPVAILNHGYMKLLDWPDVQLYPETIVMDQGRLQEMADKLQKAVLIATVLLVTYTNVGPIITSIQGFPSNLKHHIATILEGVKDHSSIMPNVADQVCTDVNGCLKERGVAEMDAMKMDALKSQVTAAGDRQHSVHKLLDSRARSFIKMLISGPINFDPATRIPPGLATVQPQLLEVAGQFVRVIGHNRTVYGPFYSEILGKILNIT